MAAGQITVQATPTTTVNIATDYDTVSNVHTNKTIVVNLTSVADDTLAIKNTLNDVKSNQTTQSNHLSDIKTKQDTQTTHLTNINTNLADIKFKQDTQTTHLTDIKAKQDTQTTHLTDIKTKQDTQTTHLTDIKANQTTQSNTLTEIRNRLAPAFNLTADDYTNNRQVVKSSAGAVYSLFCENTTSSVHYFQIHNKSTNPVNNDVPVKSILVPPNSAVGLGINEFGANGIVCSSGVSWAWSSTRTALTLATGSEKTCWVGWL